MLRRLLRADLARSAVVSLTLAALIALAAALATAATSSPSPAAARAVVVPMTATRVARGGRPSSSTTARAVEGAVSTTAPTPPLLQARRTASGTSWGAAVSVV